MDVETQLRKAQIEQLQLRRDAASMALEEAIVDMAAIGSSGGTGEIDLTIGQNFDLREELGMKQAERPTDWTLTQRARALRSTDPAVLLNLDQAAPVGIAARKPSSLAA